MTRQIRLLTKISLYGMFGFNEFRFTKDIRKKRRYCLMGLLYGLLIMMMMGYVCAMSYGLCAVGMGRFVPAVLTMCVSLLVLFFTVFKAGPVLFDRKAYEKQIVMPVTVRAIIAGRFLSMYITDMLLGLLVLLPGMTVYGKMESPGISFYLYGIAAGIFLPLLPLTIASVLGLLIAGISSRWRRKNLVSIILTLGLTCAVLAGSMRMSSMEESELTGMLEQMTVQLEGEIRSVWPPAVWIADAMVQGEAAKLLLFLAVSLGSFLLFLEILQPFYAKICVLLAAREAKGNYRMKELEEKSVLRAMVERELRHYFSSVVYVTNTLVGELLMVILAAAVLFLDTEAVEAIPGIPAGAVNRVLPVLLGFLPAMMPLTACSVSMEGKQWWMLQTMPVTGKNIIRSKVTANLLVALPFYLVSVLAVIAALRPGWADAVSLLAVPAAYICFSARAGYAINEKFPVFDWENEIRVVKQSTSVVLTMLTGMVTALIPAVILIACPDIPSYAIYAVTVILLAAGIWGMDYSCAKTSPMGA